MPKTLTVRTISHQKIAVEKVDREPEFKAGDYVEKVWNGHNCTIKAVRFNHDNGEYEYLDNSIVSDGWMLEKSISKA